MQWLCLPMLAAALLLPYRLFLPLLWVICLCCYSLMTVGLLKVIIASRNRVACWFAASLALSFLAALVEIISAVLGMRDVLGVINSVTAALASSLLAALAVAEQMRAATETREQAQRKLARAFEAMPVGLFTLDTSGVFLSTNPALRKMLGSAHFTRRQVAWRQFFGESLWRDLYEQVQGGNDAEIEIASRDASQRILAAASSASFIDDPALIALLPALAGATTPDLCGLTPAL